jgi:polysaccharide pyruvyl transferase
MTPGPQHEISNLEAGPGKLSFEARIGEVVRRVRFRSETEVEPYPEAALATALMPAMRSGGALRMSDPVSPRVLRNQREFQAIQRAWSLEWDFGDPPLREVEVSAPTRAAEPRQPSGRVAAFFSGGVDSWSTVLDNPDVTDLIFVRGIDILDRNQGEGFADLVEARLREAAAELGLPLHLVETNLRELSEPFDPSEPLARWETYYGCAVAAVALFLGRAFDRVLITGDSDYEVQEKFGANWMVDQLWSNEDLEIVDAGGRFSRLERTERIASHPTVRKSLRVCWLNPDGAYNCGQCRKCLMTMATLEAVGALEAVETFPSELDLDLVAEQTMPMPVILHLWEDVLDAARRSGKTDLERALAQVVANGKRDLGLPPNYRRRRSPAPAPGGGTDASGSLFATPATAEAIAAADAVAVLPASYDGSGNYGDIAQLDAALGMLAPLEPGLLVLPVIERQFAATHETVAEQFVHRPRHVLHFDGGGDPGGEDLVPAPPMAGLRLAVSYLYGGGFLNPWWGERKLAMLRAAEELIGGAGTVVRVSSGLQVDGGWIRGLAPADAELLRRFELLGARDDASAAALAELGGVRTLNTGDDAVGVLGALAASGEAAEDAEPLEVNVHFAEHEWVTDRPESVRDFDVELLAELARLSGRGLRVRPLLAYLDPRIDESAAVARFAAACEERGLEVGEPRVLRPANVAEVAAEMSGAVLTLSCSYHVALTSLLLAVPTALLSDNDYYAQKARGLLDDFGLPDAFSLRSSDEPKHAAAAIAPHLIEAGRNQVTRRRLLEAGLRVRRRRTDAEAELLGLIWRGGLSAIPASAAAAAVSNGPTGAAEAEARVEEAERRAAETNARLEEVLGSTSWRVTAPLRRLTNRLRGG